MSSDLEEISGHGVLMHGQHDTETDLTSTDGWADSEKEAGARDRRLELEK